MMKNKKGVTHIEIILSFIIFTGFLIFVIAIFRPFNILSNDRENADFAERAILNYSEIPVDFITLSLMTNIPSDKCFSFNSDLTKIAVKNESGFRIMAKSDSNNLHIENSGKFYYIYSSPEIIEYSTLDISKCKPIQKDSDFKLGLFRSLKMLSNSSLTRLKEKYNSDYEGLKKDLAINFDFSFAVKDSQGVILINANKTIPSRLGVSSQEMPVQIIYSNGEFKLGIMSVRTWN